MGRPGQASIEITPIPEPLEPAELELPPLGTVDEPPAPPLDLVPAVLPGGWLETVLP
jgi:hypothetical protein